MADFCNICTGHMFGEDCKPDIDVYAEFAKLKENHFINVGICEGCGLILVGNKEGKLKVHYLTLEQMNASDEEELVINWEDYVDKFHVS